MQKRDNPYTPGAGRKPRTLAGREDDVDAFTALVERLDAGSFERSLVYTLRGRHARGDALVVDSRSGRAMSRRMPMIRSRLCHIHGTLMAWPGFG